MSDTKNNCPSYFVAPLDDPRIDWEVNWELDGADPFQYWSISENGEFKTKIGTVCGNTIWVYHDGIDADHPNPWAKAMCRKDNEVYIQYKGKEELEWIGHYLRWKGDDGGFDVLELYEVESGYKDAEDSIAKSWTSVHYQNEAIAEYNRLVKGGEYDYVDLCIKDRDEEYFSWENPNPSYKN